MTPSRLGEEAASACRGARTRDHSGTDNPHPEAQPRADALSSPVDDVDPAPRPRRPGQQAEPHRAGLDKVVFGVTAAIAIAFLVWGFVSTASPRDGLRQVARPGR